MFVDVEKYRHHVQSLDLTQDRKDELIHIVYRIVESFVDRAFGIHPVQLSLGSAPQKLAESSAYRAIIDANSFNLETKGSAATTTEEEEIP
jgi:hypothetical protein